MERGWKIFSGRGQDIMEDRVFVRAMLEDVMQDAAIACVVRQCILYCPAGVLHGIELVDTPGTGTDDPLQWRQLTDELAIANGIMVVMQRTLDENKLIKSELVASGLPRRVLAAPGRFPLIIFSAVDEVLGFCTADVYVKESERYQENQTEGLSSSTQHSSLNTAVTRLD